MSKIMNDNFKINVGNPIDSKYLASTNLPYLSLTAVNAAIVKSQRYQGLTVLVNTGATNTEFWYKEGVDDTDLVVKDSSVTSNIVANNGICKTGNEITLGGVLTGETVFTQSGSSSLLKYGGDYSGDYDAQTIPDTGYVSGLTYLTASNGITKSNQTIKLGGSTPLDETTNICGADNDLNLGVAGSKLGVFGIKSNSFTISADTTGNISAGGILTIDSSSCVNMSAMVCYDQSYAGAYNNRSLVDKEYVDSVATGLDPKSSVLVATTGNITLSGLTTIDGIELFEGDRVLVKNQSSGSTNGIYIASGDTWARSEDFNEAGTEVTQGALIPVLSGDSNANTSWILTTPDPIILGTTTLSFSLFSRLQNITGSNGITVTTVAGGSRDVSIDLGTNSGLDTTGGLIIDLANNSGLEIVTGVTGGLSIDSNIAGSGLTYNNGVINANVSATSITGTPIEVKLNSGNMAVDSTNINTALNNPISGATNGLTKTTDNRVVLGGELTGNTTICGNISALTLGAAGSTWDDTTNWLNCIDINSCTFKFNSFDPTDVGVGTGSGSYGCINTSCIEFINCSYDTVRTLNSTMTLTKESGLTLTFNDSDGTLYPHAQYTHNHCESFNTNPRAIPDVAWVTGKTSSLETNSVTGSCKPLKIVNNIVQFDYTSGNICLGDEPLVTSGGSNNIAFGCNTLNSNTGNNNIAQGYCSLYSNTVGNYNIAMGCISLYSNVSGSSNIALGTAALYANTNGVSNIALGTSTLASNTTGNNNIAVGCNSMYFNTTGYNNVGLGFEALCKNTIGRDNIGLGTNSLSFNTEGSYNVALGLNSLSGNTTGSGNIAQGNSSLQSNTIGNYNIGLGWFTLKNNIDGCWNQGYGLGALLSNTTGSGNIAQGNSSLRNNDIGNHNIGIGYKTGFNSLGDYNIYVGYEAGCLETGSNKIYIGCGDANGNTLICGDTSAKSLCIDGSLTVNSGATICEELYIDAELSGVTDSDLLVWNSNTCKVNKSSLSQLGAITGATRPLEVDGQKIEFEYTNGNVYLGDSSLALTGGSNNIAFGTNTLALNTGGTYNIAQGYNSLQNNVDGSNNIAIGQSTLNWNTTGNFNIAQGYCSLFKNTTGSNNIGLGQSSMYCNTIGTNNIAFGCKSGYLNQTGNTNIFIGHNAGSYETGSNKIFIGVGDGGGDTLICGDTSAETLKINGELSITTINTGSISTDNVLVADSNGLIKQVNADTLGEDNNKYEMTVITEDTLLTTGSTYVQLVNSPLSGITVTLPANPYDGLVFRIKDAANSALDYNVSIARNGKLIDAGTNDAVLNTDSGALELVYNAQLGSWYVFSFVN